MIDNFFSWTTQNTYLFAACVKTVIDKKNLSTRKGLEVIDEESYRQHLVSCIYSLKLGRKMIYLQLSWCVYNRMSHTPYRKRILILFMKQTQLKNTDMKNRFQPVSIHFATDFSINESEPLYYLWVTCNFNYKEPIHSLI